MEITVKRRRAFILSPEPDASYGEGEPVVLGGVGFSPDFGSAGADEIVWSSNVTGFIGRGYELVTQSLPRGVHMLTLGVADGLGGEALARARLVVRPRDEYGL